MGNDLRSLDTIRTIVETIANNDEDIINKAAKRYEKDLGFTPKSGSLNINNVKPTFKM